MSYANGTTHYNLPQTVGTDKRDWADTNQAFADVDAALHTASETASSAASNISTLDGQINGAGGIDARLTTAENDIDNVEGAVSTLQTTVAGHTSAIAAVRTDCEDMIVAVEITAAQMEDSPVAIPTGSYFRYNDVLYVATSDIAIHDVIVPNTNCEATNVATEFGKVITALSDAITWNFLGSAQSSNSFTLTLPDDTNEINVVVQIGGMQYITEIPFTINGLIYSADNNLRYFRGGYYDNYGNYTSAQISIQGTEFKLSAVNSDNTDVLSTSVAHVYYR